MATAKEREEQRLVAERERAAAEHYSLERKVPTLTPHR